MEKLYLKYEIDKIQIALDNYFEKLNEISKIINNKENEIFNHFNKNPEYKGFLWWKKQKTWNDKKSELKKSYDFSRWKSYLISLCLNEGFGFQKDEINEIFELNFHTSNEIYYCEKNKDIVDDLKKLKNKEFYFKNNILLNSEYSDFVEKYNSK